MTELTLKRSGRRLEDHYDVIVQMDCHGCGPWPPGGSKTERTRTGYAETKEAAVEAFAKSWNKE
jgi:hypothetical protein